jgi:hypothetical protein
MTAATLNLNVARGVTLGPIQINCKDTSGNPVNLAGWTAFAQVRLNPAGPLVADLEPTVTNPSAGQITINLTAAQTAALTPGAFCWDLLMERPTGEVDGPFVTGSFVVARTITRTS